MLLDIKSVEFRNFLSFGNSWQKFDLEDGLNLVIGKRNAASSNGSGKCLDENTEIEVEFLNEEIRMAFLTVMEQE